MNTPLTTVLRAINRDKAKPLTILTSPTHEGYETQLCKTGHTFLSFQHPQLKRWNQNFRVVPENYIILDGTQSQIKPSMPIDLVLSQQKWGQYQILSQVAAHYQCPLIQLEHTIPLMQQPKDSVDEMGRMKGNINVFISEWSIPKWGFDANDPSVRFIEHGVDIDKFKGWKGTEKCVLSIANDFKKRGDILGFPVWERVVEGLPVKLMGNNPGMSAPAKEPQVISALQSCRVFLNTSSQSTYPLSLIEAMAVGCPVVSTATAAIPSIIHDGINGYCTNDEWMLRKRIKDLLENPELAKEIGEAGRKTAINRFNLDRFVSQWNNLFNEVVGTPGFYP